MIQLRVRVLDHKKRKPQHKENEAIQFDYSMLNDIPEDVAAEMVHIYDDLVINLFIDVGSLLSDITANTRAQYGYNTIRHYTH